MPDASNISSYLQQPTRSREEYLNEKMATGNPTKEEIREWLRMTPTIPFRSPWEGWVDPVLKGSAAVGATWLFHREMLEKQGKQ